MNKDGICLFLVFIPACFIFYIFIDYLEGNRVFASHDDCINDFYCVSFNFVHNEFN